MITNDKHTIDSKIIENGIEKYLKEHENKQLLRFLTCGSVDDGKSTLIGRLLYDSKTIFEDQLHAVKKESKKFGTTKDTIDFALLIDGLQSEREQGITIDVAYRFFNTEKRKYIIADTPGHEQYTRNMVTGASTANLAIILIDARKGVLTQTKRHSLITSLLGIKHIVVAINKMDLVNYSQERFEEIKQEYILQISQKLPDTVKELFSEPTIEFIPISALKGDNVVNRSSNMGWYKKKPLLEYLDTVEISKDINLDTFRFPVQYVNRPNLDFRGFSGTITSGSISVGDKIVVLPSKKSSKVKNIINASDIVDKNGYLEKKSNLKSYYAPMAITLTLEDEIDISRGDLIVKADDLVGTSDEIEAIVVWMDEEPLKIAKEYEIKRATTSLSALFNSIEYKIDVNSWEKIKSDDLKLNEIGKCSISLTREIACDNYSCIKGTGSFIVIDKITNRTVAAGMITKQQKSDKRDQKEYSEAERELNRFIRKHYPEWGCKKI